MRPWKLSVDVDNICWLGPISSGIGTEIAAQHDGIALDLEVFV